MKTLYFECSSGVSGNMIIGALIDLLQCKEEFLKEINKLNLEETFEISIIRSQKHEIYGSHVDVFAKNSTESRNIFDIRKIIDASMMTNNAKKIAHDIFEQLAKAEAIVHKTTIGKVHFHEVGATDAIIDICSCGILLDKIQYDEIVISPINLGCGKVKCAHGILDVPVPAVKEMLKNIPSYFFTEEGELTTPTGAAIIKTVADRFNVMDTDGFKVGIGLGTKNLKTQANILKVYYDA